MTPDHLHLDDEALSAVLDGEATPDESAHVEACAECSARLAALRGASVLVGTPVEPADPARREAAIAAALAAAPSNVVSIQARRRGVPAWLGAAAAAVVAIVAIGVVAGSADDDDADDTAAGGDDTTSAEMAQDAAGDVDESFTTMAAAGPAEGGDLGAIEDVDLQAAVTGALAARQVAGSGGGQDGDAEEEATAETTVADSAAATGMASSCEDPVRADDPQLGALVYRASGTYEGVPAVVLGFDVIRDDGAVDRRVYVLAVEDCSIRLAETYSA